MLTTCLLLNSHMNGHRSSGCGVFSLSAGTVVSMTDSLFEETEKPARFTIITGAKKEEDDAPKPWGGVKDGGSSTVGCV